MKSRHLYIFVGPPGSGKGSLSHLCTKELGWIQLSTGDLCRKNIAEQTDIGQRIDFAIKSGKLVSDGLITEMVVQWFEIQPKLPDAVILDGYPRTVAQAQALSELLENRLAMFNLRIVRFFLSDESVVARLTGRYICTNQNCQAVYSLVAGSLLAPKESMKCDLCGSSIGRRSDDHEQAVRARLKVYHKHEQNLLDFFAGEGYMVDKCNVEKSLEDVFIEFKQLVGTNVA